MSIPNTPLKTIRGTWDRVESCCFLRCVISATIGWCSVRCDFQQCTFLPGEYSAEKSLDVDAFVQAPADIDPATAWTNDAAKPGKVVFHAATIPYSDFDGSPWMGSVLQDDPAYRKWKESGRTWAGTTRPLGKRHGGADRWKRSVIR